MGVRVRVRVGARARARARLRVRARARLRARVELDFSDETTENQQHGLRDSENKCGERERENGM